MVRERLNAVDVAAVVGNLQKQILDYNLVNIYDVTSRIYVLKLSKNQDKKFVLFEIGHRIHTTQFLRSTDHLPSNFNVKLRKHLRMRKLRGINQIAQDRVVDFTFSSGEYAYHLIVQLFLPGNVYLTDYTYKVLTVLRPQNAGDAFFRVGETYMIPETSVPWGVRVSQSIIDEALDIMQSSSSTTTTSLPDTEVADEKTSNNGPKGTKQNPSGGKGNSKSKGQDANSNDTEKDTLETADDMKENSLHLLLKIIFPSVHIKLIDHVLRNLTDDAHLGLRNVDTMDMSEISEAVEAMRKTVESVSHAKGIVPGYLHKGGQEYDDFIPVDLGSGWERFDDFNDALDAYFTKFEMKKIEKKEQPKKPIKLQKIKDDQNRREIMRQKEVEKLTNDIEMVESNRAVFDTVLDLLRTLVATGASWQEIRDQLANQRSSGHILAQHIRSVNIPERRVDVCLPSDDPSFYNSGPQPQGKSNKKNSKKNTPASDLCDNSTVTLDYGLTCFQNLEVMYEKKKRVAEKLERTRAGHEFALKRVNKEKEKGGQKKVGKSVSLVKVRKRMWFEKFHWFITSDGYLVLGGRDAAQNELLVKRYLTKGDLYFHADVHGASSCILKNPKETAESHNNSIEEAACFAICLSSAWNQKMVVPAWWVHHHQVSRSAPTGEYLPHGSFMIRGKKNYVQPQRLEMAIGVVFHVDVPQLEVEMLNHVEDQDDVTQSATEVQKDSVSFVDVDEHDSRASRTDSGDTTPSVASIVLSFSVGSEAESDFMEQKPAVVGFHELVNAGDQPTEEAKEIPQKPKGVGFMLSADSESESEPRRVVAFNLDNLPEKTQHTPIRRKATGYPCRGFDPDDLVGKLSELGLIDTDTPNIEPGHVRFIEAEKPEHSPESVARLRQRMPTGFHGSTKKQKPASKVARMKTARAKKKYDEEDEEILELRCKLTGSKLPQLEEKRGSIDVKRESSVTQAKPVFQRQAIKPLDDQELSSHMNQLRMLTKEPGDGDVIIGAVPMCAPYSALKTHPYHLKLVPGNFKKGVIAAQALKHFLKVDEAKAEFVKLITTDQFALTLIENCKVPGGPANPKKP
ncbi:Ribosome quality control complex subunit 2 [Babesia sp. Xinjiang]|uniref:Ribosome quality control complex subunit 2 n=1 Tax=Babesia sp. Xinjiang TaxID=462227 RepID=UPI000A23F3AD|nr:Ribosome quality control complex subunit 2 [Babesia sp. Xinjiang]ORM41292.1 Ribosome quality control complex subunit 2 [Babesia sp. Xinjiang]